MQPGGSEMLPFVAVTAAAKRTSVEDAWAILYCFDSRNMWLEPLATAVSKTHFSFYHGLRREDGDIVGLCSSVDEAHNFAAKWIRTYPRATTRRP